MPTSVSIDYVSDFGTAQTSSTTDETWLEWSMVAGDTYYSGSPPGTLSVDSSSQFTISLTRSGTDPTVGDYTVTLKVKLNYNNGGTEFLMDEVDYSFNVNVAGVASTTDISTPSAANTNGNFNYADVTEDTTGNGQVVSAIPGNLELAQVGGTASFGEDITIQATTSTPGYTIWIDATENILASDDLTFDGSDYEWPNDAVTSSVSSETGITNSVDITLKSVPAEVFNYGSVYVQLTVHFRDASNDSRRSLRSLDEDGSSLQSLNEDSIQVTALVAFDSGNGSGATIDIISILPASVAAVTAGVVLLSPL